MQDDLKTLHIFSKKSHFSENISKTAMFRQSTLPNMNFTANYWFLEKLSITWRKFLMFNV